jgi:peptide chain release factor 3
MTWPINSGKEFKGVYNIDNKSLRLFTASTKADEEDTIAISDLSDSLLDAKVGERDAAQLREDVELIDGVYGELNADDYLAGKIAPVFFGSAVNNFGVKEMLDTFIRIAPVPRSRETSRERLKWVKMFSAVSFLRSMPTSIPNTATGSLLCGYAAEGLSGTNITIMCAWIGMRFSNPYSFMARSKDIIDDAYAGDVVGLFDTGTFKIGDTLTEGEDFYFSGIPTFSPEIFKELVNKDPMKTKQLEKGISQLTDEGVAQLFTQFGGNKKIIGCVGELQFEVIQYRLLQEYGAACEFRSLPFYKACWLTSKDEKSWKISSGLNSRIQRRIKMATRFTWPKANGS